MKQFGFSLVELVVVVTIIALLSTVGVVSYKVVKLNSRDSRRIADLEAVRVALEVYRADCSAYPTTIVGGAQLVGGPTTAPCYNNIYMEKVPKDPKDPTYTYVYRYVSANKYYLCSYYEILPTTMPQPTINSACNSGACSNPAGTSCKYFVTNP